MPAPVVTNISPAEGSQSGVAQSTRFSVRDVDTEIDRGQLQLHIGAGPAFYPGGKLPEDIEDTNFLLEAFSGNPNAPAVRSIEPSGELKIDKTLPLPQNQEALYFFGGLQSPAAPDDILMGEFTLRLAQADVVTDVNDYTGVLFGFMINDSGLTVKFYTTGTVRSIEVHDARFTSVAIGVATFEWDDGVAHTYKVLWDPVQNIVKLFVSTGTETTADTLLVSGLVGNFPDLPVEERRTSQPWAFFGHSHPENSSISFWTSVQLYHLVTQPVINGIFQGEHEGFIRTNNEVVYDASTLPRDAESPWKLLPDSFGIIGGFEAIEGNSLVLRRSEGASFGFFRQEPKVIATTILDFKIAGAIISQAPSEQSTGIEVFIDDGVKALRFALIVDATGDQYVGVLLTATNPEIFASYLSTLTGWSLERPYRIVFDPVGDSVIISRIIDTNEGKLEQVVLNFTYSLLPPSSMPGPGIGFLLNANAGDTFSQMSIRDVRYSTDVTILEADDFPTPVGWNIIGTGTITAAGAIFTMDSTIGSILIQKDFTGTLQTDNGFSVEWRTRILSYSVGGVLNPVRADTGVVLRIVEGTFVYTIAFVDVGPPFGRVVLLVTDSDSDVDKNILAVRAGDSAVSDTFTPIDWTQFHLYRFEKTVGGQLRLFVDEVLLIDFEQSKFDPPVNSFDAPPRIILGHSPTVAISEWQFARLSISDGFDVSAVPVLKEKELLARFKNSINVIAEAGDV